MQAKRIPNLAADDASNDSAVLDLLLMDGHSIWAVEEITRELGDITETVDAINRLKGAGLVHALDGFVFASRAATRARALQE